MHSICRDFASLPALVSIAAIAVPAINFARRVHKLDFRPTLNNDHSRRPAA